MLSRLDGRVRQGGAVVLAAAVLGCIWTGQAQAQPPLLESTSPIALPSQGNDGFSTSSTACASTSCASVGSWEDSSGHTHAFVASSANGIGGTGQIVALPNGANESVPDAELYGVSCWSTASCVAVGFYEDSSGNEQGLVVPITNGVAGPGTEVSLPSGASRFPDAYMYGVSCGSDGVCEAVGAYDDQSFSSQAMTLTITAGVPSAATKVTLPADAVSSSQQAELAAVSCWSGGDCEAVGYYTNSSGYEPLAVMIAGGTPGAVTRVSLPGDAKGSSQTAGVDVLSCWSAGSCALVGHYKDSANASQTFGGAISGGAPGPGVKVAMPSAATGAVSLQQIGCTATGACLAVGYYQDGSTNDYAFDLPIDGATVGAGEDVSLPSDASSSSPDAVLYGVGCSVSGPCLAVGDYAAETGGTLPMTLTMAGTTISAATVAPLPADQSATPQTGLYSVGCGSSGSCAAFGMYENNKGVAMPYLMGAQAALTVGATSLPAGEIGSAYAQTLSATGAWGIYNWSVASGTLPAGLSLNSATGVVSGTPTTPGSSTFTVQATGTGSPTQTATQSLSVTVAAPGLKVVGSSATVRKNRLGLKLSCSGGACAGAATLQITESYVVKHGKRRVHKHGTVAIGSVHFSLAAGQTQTYTVALNAAGRKALKTHKRWASTVLATVDGVKQTVGQLTLKAAAVKHKRK